MKTRIVVGDVELETSELTYRQARALLTHMGSIAAAIAAAKPDEEPDVDAAAQPVTLGFTTETKEPDPPDLSWYFEEDEK